MNSAKPKHWKPNLRDALFCSLFRAGVPAVLRWLQGKERVSIICYHDPAPELLARHFEYLQKHYNFVSLTEVLDAWDNGTALSGRPLVVTLDDGHRGNFALMPVFQRYAVKPTIFLCSAIAGTKRGFWFMHVPRAELGSFKSLSNAQRRDRLTQLGFQFEQAQAEREALSAEEIAEMASVVDFQAHSRFHPILPTCDDNEARSEITDCLAELSQQLGIRSSVFAYPNGSYSPRDRQLVIEAGYRAAVTVDTDYNDRLTDRFTLKRTCIPDISSVAELAVKTSGLWTLLLRFKATCNF